MLYIMNQITEMEWIEKLQLGVDLKFKTIRKRMQDQGVDDNQRIMNAAKIGLSEVVNSVVQQQKRIFYDNENKDGQISSASFPNEKEISKKFMEMAVKYLEEKYQ
jgi:hypothetical protein